MTDMLYAERKLAIMQLKLKVRSKLVQKAKMA